jgi:phosphoglycerol transferase MdoB-like AlkP superfamily enzyme
METKPSLLQHTLLYGAIMGVISIIFSLIMYITGYMPVGIKSGLITALITIIILIIFISFGMKSYRDKALGGNITFGQAFLVGILIVIISTLISSLYTLLFTTVIDPDYMGRVMEATRNSTYDMMNNMGASDADIEDALERFDKRVAKMTPIRTFFQGFIWPLILGAIVSLIVAAFTRKIKNPVA